MRLELGLIIFLSLGCVILLVMLIHSMYTSQGYGNLYRELTQKYEELLNDSPTMNIGDRVTSTTQLFDLIDAMISLEIINTRKFEIFLNNKRKNIDYDAVVKDVSTNVFNAIRPDVYNDPDNIVTSDYLLSVIQKRTLVQYLTYYKANTSGEPMT